MNSSLKKLSSVTGIIAVFIFLILTAASSISCSPAKYNEHEVSIRNPKDGIKLAGTLTVPRDKKLFAAVLLIQGTGPHNRDEEVLGHKLFRDIADYLSSDGVAVLRLDRRGCGKSGGQYIELDMENYVSDALCALSFLKKYPGVDKNKTGLAGHSLGGMIAAMASARSKEVSFIISMGGPGIWGKNIGYSLNKLWAECSGLKPEYLPEIKRLSYRWFELTTKECPTQADASEFSDVYTRLANFMNDDIRRLFYPGPADKAFSYFRSKEYRAALLIDPGPVWSNVSCPVLAVNGSRDMQVSADVNLNAIKRGLETGKNHSYKIIKLEDHNHLFQRTKNGSPAEYEKIKEGFSPVMLNLVCKWINTLAD